MLEVSSCPRSIEVSVPVASLKMTRSQLALFLVFLLFCNVLLSISCDGHLFKEKLKLNLLFLVKGFQTKCPFIGAFVFGSPDSFELLDELLTSQNNCTEVLLFSHPINSTAFTESNEHPVFDVLILILDSGEMVIYIHFYSKFCKLKFHKSLNRLTWNNS